MAKSERGNDRYTIRIPDSLRDEMLKVCKDENMTPSKFIRECIAICLDIRAGNKQRKEIK